MDSQAASKTLIVFMAVICVLCIYGIIFPKQLINWVNNFWNQKAALYISVVFRLILGLLFVFSAPVSKHPGLFEFVGYLTIAAAVILLFIGRRKIGLLLTSAKTWPPIGLRAWLLFGLAFFGFMISALV